jgi:hypothetical protein
MKPRTSNLAEGVVGVGAGVEGMGTVVGAVVVGPSVRCLQVARVVAVVVVVAGDDLCRWTANKRTLDRPNNIVRTNHVRHATKTGAKLTTKATNDGA